MISTADRPDAAARVCSQARRRHFGEHHLGDPTARLRCDRGSAPAARLGSLAAALTLAESVEGAGERSLPAWVARSVSSRSRRARSRSLWMAALCRPPVHIRHDEYGPSMHEACAPHVVRSSRARRTWIGRVPTRGPETVAARKASGRTRRGDGAGRHIEDARSQLVQRHHNRTLPHALPPAGRHRYHSVTNLQDVCAI